MDGFPQFPTAFDPDVPELKIERVRGMMERHSDGPQRYLCPGGVTPSQLPEGGDCDPPVIVEG